jgi:hypothetical protein
MLTFAVFAAHSEAANTAKDPDGSYSDTQVTRSWTCQRIRRKKSGESGCSLSHGLTFDLSILIEYRMLRRLFNPGLVLCHNMESIQTSLNDPDAANVTAFLRHLLLPLDLSGVASENKDFARQHWAQSSWEYNEPIAVQEYLKQKALSGFIDTIGGSGELNVEGIDDAIEVMGKLKAGKDLAGSWKATIGVLTKGGGGLNAPIMGQVKAFISSQFAALLAHTQWPDDSKWDEAKPAAWGIDCSDASHADKLEALYSKYPSAHPMSKFIEVKFNLTKLGKAPHLNYENLPNAREQINTKTGSGFYGSSARVKCVSQYTTVADFGLIFGGGCMYGVGSCIDTKTEEALSFQKYSEYFNLMIGFSGCVGEKLCVGYGKVQDGPLDDWILRKQDHASIACAPDLTPVLGFIPLACDYYQGSKRASEVIWPVGGGASLSIFRAGSTDTNVGWRGCTVESEVYKQWWTNKFLIWKYKRLGPDANCSELQAKCQSERLINPEQDEMGDHVLKNCIPGSDDISASFTNSKALPPLITIFVMVVIGSPR